MTSTEANSESLEARVRRLEDLEAIRDLKARYAQYCDDGYDPDGIASLFTEDGVWEASFPPGIYRSREEIREFFTGVSKEFVWALHYVVRPTIEISESGDSAEGSWYFLGPMTIRDEGKDVPILVTGIYRDRYVKRDGRWWITHTKLETHQFSEWQTGWVEQRFRGAS